MKPKSVKQIRHNPSRFVTHSVAVACPSCQNRPNASQSVTWFGDGSVTDFRERKTHKIREKLSLSMNPSRCHAYPRAMRAHAYKGGVTDIGDGFDFCQSHCDEPAVRSCGKSTIWRQYENAALQERCSAFRRNLGTPGPMVVGDARGNSRQSHHSLFSLSEMPLFEITLDHNSLFLFAEKSWRKTLCWWKIDVQWGYERRDKITKIFERLRSRRFVAGMVCHDPAGAMERVHESMAILLANWRLV